MSWAALLYGVHLLYILFNMPSSILTIAHSHLLQSICTRLQECHYYTVAAHYAGVWPLILMLSSQELSGVRFYYYQWTSSDPSPVGLESCGLLFPVRRIMTRIMTCQYFNSPILFQNSAFWILLISLFNFGLVSGSLVIRTGFRFSRAANFGLDSTRGFLFARNFSYNQYSL